MMINMLNPIIASRWRRRRRQASPHWLTGFDTGTGSSLQEICGCCSHVC